LTRSKRYELIARLRLPERRWARRPPGPQQDVPVTLAPEQTHILSPGRHNLLEKAVVEMLGPALLKHPQVVYLGDTAPRVGYQNHTLMRHLNLPIDVSVSLPDVILYGPEEQTLLIVEAVVSSGPVTPIRLAQLQGLAAGPENLGIRTTYISAFPSRRIFRRFVEDLAWGSSVWIADEPYNIVHFVTLS